MPILDQYGNPISPEMFSGPPIDPAQPQPEMMGGLDPGMMQPPESPFFSSSLGPGPDHPGPPSFQFLPAQPLNLSKKKREEAEEYVKQLINTSIDYIQRKRVTWDHRRRWLDRDISIFNWSGSTSSTKNQEAAGGLTDYVRDPRPIITQFVTTEFLSLFQGPQWFSVRPKDVPDFGPGDPNDPNVQYDAVFKLESYLHDQLRKADIIPKMWILLFELAVFGAAYCTVGLKKRKVTTWRIWDDSPGLAQLHNEDLWELAIACLPLETMIVDPKALTPDPDEMRFIGHEWFATYEEIEEKFQNGDFYLNHKDFKDRWEHGSGDTEPAPTWADEDAEYLDDDRQFLKIRKIHARIPIDGELQEVVSYLVGDRGDDQEESDSSVLVAQDIGSDLPSGMRPYASVHYSPQDQPFGDSMLDESEDLFKRYSHLWSQMHDMVRYASLPPAVAHYDMQQQVSATHNKLMPGVVYYSANPNRAPLNWIAPPSFPLQPILETLNDLEGKIAEATAQKDMWPGGDSARITATHAQSLADQVMAPTNARGILIGPFFSRIADLSLQFLQTINQQGLAFWVRDRGQDVQIQISTQEMRGKYEVQAVVADQNANRIATANSIKELLRELPNLLPLYEQQGANLDIVDLTRNLLQTLRLPGSNRILQRWSTQEQMLRDQLMQMQQYVQDMEAQMGGAPGPGPNGNGQQPQGPPPEAGPPMAMNGGPMGPEPTDPNIMAQMLQMEQAENAQ